MKTKFRLLLCLLISLTLALGIMPCAFCADNVSQPYESGTAGSELFRIPAMITLKNGDVITSADVRYGNGTDSPANIDTGVRVSHNAGAAWSDINLVNHFSDFEDRCSSRAYEKSASFIDSALLQSPTGRVFLICDACPAYIGSNAASKNGSGLIDGRFVLCSRTTGDGTESGKLTKEAYPYYIGDSENGFAPVLRFSDGKNYGGYFVDEEFFLYRMNGGTLEKVFVHQYDREGKETSVSVQANVFYADSPLKIYPTFYCWLRTSDDSGRTWSRPHILNGDIAAEGFTGVCPGRGFVYTADGASRIMFAVYDNNSSIEKTSVIYSDNDGVTWQRGEKIRVKGTAHKTSETQMISLPDGTIRAYSRNFAKRIGYADSKDGGITWTRHYVDFALKYCSNCMVSFINYSGKIGGKDVVIASYPSKANRRLGVIKVGLVQKNNRIEWAYEYKVTDSRDDFTYCYSCLSELPDGNIALLYENAGAEITYTVFSLSELVSEENEVGSFRLLWQRLMTFLMRPLAFI